MNWKFGKALIFGTEPSFQISSLSFLGKGFI